MTTREDIDRVSRPWFEMLQAASEIHTRDGHCGALFDSCPFFPCNVVRDVANELLREQTRVNLRPHLVSKLDMCAVAENLK